MWIEQTALMPSGDGITEDEESTDNMSPELKARKLELRRLRKLNYYDPGFDNYYAIDHSKYWAKVGNQIVKIRTCFFLSLRNDVDGDFASDLNKRLEISRSPPSEPHPDLGDAEYNPQEVENALNRISALQKANTR